MESKKYEDGWRPKLETREIVSQMLDIIYSGESSNDEASMAWNTIWMALDPTSQEAATDDMLNEWKNPSIDVDDVKDDGLYHDKSRSKIRSINGNCCCACIRRWFPRSDCSVV